MSRVAWVVAVVAVGSVGFVVAAAASGAGVARNGRIALALTEQVASPGLARVGADGSGRRLSLPGSLVWGPVVSPDRTRVACVVEASAGSGSLLFVLGADGSRTRIGPSSQGPSSWSPDGTQVAFVDPQGGDIEVAAADGGSVRSLGVHGVDPVWSPRGDRIAFYSSLNTLELIKPDGSGRSIVTTDAYEGWFPTAWSPDGGWLAFGAVRATGPGSNVVELNVARADGSSRRSLGMGTGMAWSPSADVLAFDSDEHGFELVTPDGSVVAGPWSIGSKPVWSPDGRYVAVADPEERRSVEVVDTRASTVRPLPLTGDPAWSPRGDALVTIQGTRVETASLAGGRAGVIAGGGAAQDTPVWLRGDVIFFGSLPRTRDVIETRSEGGDAKTIVHTAPVYTSGTPPIYTALVWSPNGTRLAFVRQVRGGSRLLVAAADGTGTHALARDPAGAPAWSPDGRRLAFVAHGLRIVDAGGGRVRKLAGGDVVYPPVWSPDGRRIAFLAAGGGLYSVAPDGRHLKQLAHDASLAPSWSPGGSRLAFSVGDASLSATAIDTIRSDGTGRMQLVSAPPAGETGDVLSEPHWSPDGRTILYTDEHYQCGSKCSYTDLHLIRPDGTHPRKLPFILGEAAWSPDGKQLLGEIEGHVTAIDVRTGKTRLTSLAPASAWSWQPLPR
jgi:Tol biopolymer transport system component